MTQPYAMPAHEFRIQSLLGLPGANSDKHYDTSDIDLDTYGLQTPGAHIQFNNTHIYFGKTNPVTGFRYVQINNTMHLLLDNLYPLIRSQATSFVDLALLPDKAKIKRLNLPDIELVHAQKGWSSSTQNITADQIHTLLQSWHYAKAFATHGYTQRESLGQIKIEFDQHKTIEFSITAEQPWMILARADMGIEYHLDASQKSALLPPLKP